MLSLSFGLTAALLWATHDLLARKLSQGVPLLPLVALVLGAGCLPLIALVVVFGGWDRMTGAAWVAAIASGFAVSLAIGGLYRAFSMAPVRLVSPIVGAYPLLTLIIAAAQGRAITDGDWLAVALIVAGIAIVALTSREESPGSSAAPPWLAITWAVLAAVGFAGTFALGQLAARLGSDLPVMLVGRAVAFAILIALIGWSRGPALPPRRYIWVLIGMGLIDALALGLVTAAGSLPKAEYAAVSSSLFGVLTVLLAVWFLKEHARPVQWLGIATVFSGIAVLGLQSL